jgi:hypothetical protein
MVETPRLKANDDAFFGFCSMTWRPGALVVALNDLLICVKHLASRKLIEINEVSGYL